MPEPCTCGGAQRIAELEQAIFDASIKLCGERGEPAGDALDALRILGQVMGPEQCKEFGI